MYPEVYVKGSSLKRLIFGTESPDPLVKIKGVLSIDPYTITFLNCEDMELRTLPIYEGKVNRKINFVSKTFAKLLFLSNDEEYLVTFDPPLMLVYTAKNRKLISEIEGKVF
jgi:hypothetical protein